MEGLKKVCLTLLIIGGINWGLVGIFDFNLVEAIFKENSFITKLIYALVGVSALVSISTLFSHITSDMVKD